MARSVRAPRGGAPRPDAPPRSPGSKEVPLQEHGEDEAPGADEEHAAVVDGGNDQGRERRSHERSRGSPCRDEAEEAPGLRSIEDVEEERPEDGDDEEVEDADPDVEDLPGNEVPLVRREGEARDAEREGHGAVDPGEEGRAAEVSDEPTVGRDDRDGQGPGPDEQGCRPVPPQHGSYRLSHRAHREVAPQHEKEHQEGGQHRAGLFGLHAGRARQEPLQGLTSLRHDRIPLPAARSASRFRLRQDRIDQRNELVPVDLDQLLHLFLHE
jgi:hypothetical protein